MTFCVVLSILRWGKKSWRPWFISFLVELISQIAVRKGYESVNKGRNHMMTLEKQEFNRRLKAMVLNVMRGAFYLKITRPRLERFCNRTESKPIISMAAGKDLYRLLECSTKMCCHKVFFAITCLSGNRFTFTPLLHNSDDNNKKAVDSSTKEDPPRTFLVYQSIVGFHQSFILVRYWYNFLFSEYLVSFSFLFHFPSCCSAQGYSSLQ